MQYAETSDAAAGALERAAAMGGTALALATLGLTLLADAGWFRLSLAPGVLALATLAALGIWRRHTCAAAQGARASLLGGVGVILLGVLLIAPGSEHIVGPRDPGVYAATAFTLARHGGLIVADPALQLLAEDLPPGEHDLWIYRHFVSGAPLRYPAPLFLHDATHVEGGFLPGLVVWMALAFQLGGLEPALHASGAFGVLALGYAMLAYSTTLGAGQRWGALLVGLLLALSFSQIWWAREAMAESALGTWAWMGAWAACRWAQTTSARWAILAGLAGVSALFTRADGVLVAAGLLLTFVLLGSWSAARVTIPLGVVALGLAAYTLHAVLVAPVYLALTYGTFTLGRASAGAAALVTLMAGLVLARRRWLAGRRPNAAVGRVLRSLALVALVAGALLLATGQAPGVGRAATVGAPSPLGWLPAYIPWPILLLAGAGVVALVFGPHSPRILPVLLIGGIPALFYLPDPLVTGDHPWMVRRLVPAVVPLLAMLAALGAAALYRAGVGPHVLRRAGPVVAASLVGLGLGLSVVQLQGLAREPRHGAGISDALSALAGALPADAVVVFPASPAGTHLAMPLHAVHGVATLAIPSTELSPAIAQVLARWDARGIPVYWADDRGGTTITSPVPRREIVARERVRWRSADGGLVPPPLGLRTVDLEVTVARLRFAV